MTYTIQVEELKKSYGAHTVLNGISFAVRQGEIVSLLGINGAGKTTALECIEGLRRYDGGRIAVHGRMGIQLQSASLPSHIRPMEAVRLFAKWNRTKANPAVLEALGIHALGKKQYCDLSTGQKRRLHLALALTGDPDILFLDEPTAGLDVEGRQSLHDQIRALKAEGKTIVLASHDMAEVERLCDRIAILHEGTIVFEGAVSELTERVGKRFLIHIQTERGDEDVTSSDIAETLRSMLEEYQQKGISVSDIRIDRGSLEEHFIQLTRGTIE